MQLAQLVPQCARARADLIVARPSEPGEIEALDRLYPEVLFVRAPVGATDAQLRGLAIVQATGDIVLFADDRRSMPRGWLDAVRRRVAHDAEPESPADAAIPSPLLSVIVPVHQGAGVLPASLGALIASDLPRATWELIVVDDASTDDSVLAAAPFADTIVRIPRKAYGPAYARNRGFQLSRGEYVVFVDADVCVHRETLGRFAAAFAADPEVSAISGSYDDCPPGGLVSRYRSLLQHFHHQQSAGPVDRFWACCGAVRARVFAEAGMYDEWRFRRPQIEDVELGHRIRALGYHAVLRPEIQATHLKKWTLRSMIATNLHGRGVPWMRLDAPREDGAEPLAVRRGSVQAANTALTWLAIAVAGLALALREPAYLWGAVALLAPALYNNRGQYAFFLHKCGLAFALAAVPLDLMNYAVNGVAVAVGWALRQLVGDAKPDPAVQAFAEVGIKTWPPVPSRSTVRGANSSLSV
jgi:GT2 family glycosyltransferase